MHTTRRDFAKGLLAAGLAAAVTPRRLFAAVPADFDETFAVFLSDVHVNGLDKDAGNGKPFKTSMRHWLKANVAEILRMEPLPRHVFIFGDLAHLQGRLVDYKRSYPDLRLLIDAGIKLTIGMGNHDHRKAFLEIWPEYEKRTLLPGAIHTVTSLQGRSRRVESDVWRVVARFAGVGAFGVAEMAAPVFHRRPPSDPRIEIRRGPQKALERLHREIPELPRLHTRPRPHLENECRQLARTQDRAVADTAVQRMLGRHRICHDARGRPRRAASASPPASGTRTPPANGRRGA